MADPSTITSAAGGGPLGSSLGAAQGVLSGSMSNLLGKGNEMIDRFFPPDRREAWKSWLAKFATERPKLAAFLLSQLALSGPALALFAIMVLTIFIFSLLAGILIGLLGALLFIVFAVGVALIFLLPVLFFTTAAAVFFFLFGLGSYYIVKWFNKKDVPGVHTGLADGVKEQSGLGQLPGVDGNRLFEDPMQGGGEDGEEAPQKPPKKREEGAEKGTSTGAQHHVDGKENGGQANPRKSAGKAASGVKDGVGGGVGGVTGNARKTIGV